LPFLDLVAYSFSFSGRSREGSQAAAAGGAPTWTTELQQHVAYFDTDNDGIVTYSETEAGVTKMAIDLPIFSSASFPFLSPRAHQTEKVWLFFASIVGHC
jgi:hypothetical protein